MESPGVSLVGSGNLAANLARRLNDGGATIHEVYGRNQEKASLVAGSVDALPKTDLDFSSSKAEVILICTPDEAIKDIASSMIIPSTTTLVHTSGTTSLASLSDRFISYGVLYPLQTFSSSHPVSLKSVPIFIEANNDETKKRIGQLASLLSPDVRVMSSEDRRILHLAAVFANNFVNHLLSISETLLRQIDLDLETIQPLIMETVKKAYAMGPADAQTGPAKREDISIIKAHEKLLIERLPAGLKIYQEHSRGIGNLRR